MPPKGNLSRQRFSASRSTAWWSARASSSSSPRPCAWLTAWARLRTSSLVNSRLCRFSTVFGEMPSAAGRLLHGLAAVDRVQDLVLARREVVARHDARPALASPLEQLPQALRRDGRAAVADELDPGDHLVGGGGGAHDGIGPAQQQIDLVVGGQRGFGDDGDDARALLGGGAERAQRGVDGDRDHLAVHGVDHLAVVVPRGLEEAVAAQRDREELTGEALAPHHGDPA